MDQFSLTDAKQRFSQWITAAASAPVAIEKHGRVQAIVVSPDFFERAKKRSRNFTPPARQGHPSPDRKDRLIRHLKIAFDLVALAPGRRDSMTKEARAVVERWRIEPL